MVVGRISWAGVQKCTVPKLERKANSYSSLAGPVIQTNFFGDTPTAGGRRTLQSFVFAWASPRTSSCDSPNLVWFFRAPQLLAPFQISATPLSMTQHCPASMLDGRYPRLHYYSQPTSVCVLRPRSAPSLPPRLAIESMGPLKVGLLDARLPHQFPYTTNTP